MKKQMITETKFEVLRDGKTIRGIEYRPRGEKLPIAIVSHGFLATYKTTKHYARKLAEWGYAAYCFDFIGGGIGSKSDGKLSEMSVLTEKKDLYAVIEYVRGLPYTHAEALTLMGCSQGGFVSALVASELGDMVKKLFLFYPAFCIPDDARAGKMMLFKFDPQNIPDTISCGPIKLGGAYARAVIAMNPYAEIVGYHGNKDGIVNVSYAYQAKDAYGENCTMKIISGAHHGFKKKDDRVALAVLCDFLRIRA